MVALLAPTVGGTRSGCAALAQATLQGSEINANQLTTKGTLRDARCSLQAALASATQYTLARRCATRAAVSELRRQALL